MFKPLNDCAAGDVPEGLALVPIHDSGDNHALHNAATSAWTRLWNHWDWPNVKKKIENELHLRPKTASQFRKELRAYYGLPVAESLLETLWASFKENDYSHPALRKLYGDGCTPIGWLPPR